ncbi:hypothetical protein [Pantoea agglomerans]|jgi:hypothetical protein|uniref:hypothetical protein n=1 Tax=Enterobacter agglomerans TaxID=549 RepID=UPI003C7A0AF5
MIRYRGADIETILMWLNKKCSVVRLQMVGPNRWSLYCLSDERGEFEQEGPLQLIIINAFKPMADEFEAWAEETKKAFVGMLRSLVDYAETKAKPAEDDQ